MGKRNRRVPPPPEEVRAERDARKYLESRAARRMARSVKHAQRANRDRRYRYDD